MGLVQRQGIKYSILNLTGLLIGIASTLLVYPKVLREVGMFRFLTETSLLLYPFLSLGVNTVTIRYFPRFADARKGHHGYLGLLLLVISIGYLVFLGLGLIWGGDIEQWYISNRNSDFEREVFSRYFWMIYPLAGLTMLNSFFVQYSSNANRIVIGSLLNDFLPKIITPVLFLLYYLGIIPLNGVYWGVLGQFLFTNLGLIIYLRTLGFWHFKRTPGFPDKTLLIDMVKYAGFGLLSTTSFMLIVKLDSWSITTFLSLTLTGVYSIASLFANVMDIPMKAIIGSSAPLLAKHWNDENHEELLTLYQKASINLFIPGLLLFGVILLAMDQFFALFLSKEQLVTSEMIESARWVVFFLGGAKIIEMVTGLNNYMISYSRYYYYQMYSLIVIGVSSIGFNLLLVPLWGMTGAAAATLFTTILYNTVSLIIMWKKFNFLPFTRATLYTSILAIILFLAVVWIPLTGNPFIDLMLRPGIYACSYFGAVLWLRLSPDLNQVIFNLIKYKKI